MADMQLINTHVVRQNIELLKQDHKTMIIDLDMVQIS